MKRNEKQERLLISALEIFARYGYKKATVEDVAGAIGITKGGLYKYVKDKKDLYHKAVSYALGKWQDRVAEAIANEPDIVKKFSVMAKKGFEYLIEDNDLREILKNDPSIFPYSPQIVRFKEVNDRSLRLIESLLQEGIKNKTFTQIDTKGASELFYSMYRMFIIETYVISDTKDIENIYQLGIELILNGLLVRN